MTTGEKCHILGRCKTEATKIDVDAPKLSRKIRVPIRIEEFFGGKAAPECQCYFPLSYNIF